MSDWGTEPWRLSLGRAEPVQPASQRVGCLWGKSTWQSLVLTVDSKDILEILPEKLIQRRKNRAMLASSYFVGKLQVFWGSDHCRFVYLCLMDN